MIFGVDLGTRRIALACPDLNWVWATSLERAAPRREFASEMQAGRQLGVLARDQVFGLLFANLGATSVEFYAERPLLGRPHLNAQTTIGQSLSAGAALSMLPGPCVLLKHPSLWKKALCGNGNASKDDIAGYLTRHHPALTALCYQDQDILDAIGIALGAAVLASTGEL